MKVNIPAYPKTNSRKKARRVKIQIDKWDTWQVDSTLALIILPCLLQLKETKQGVPNDFVDVGGADYEHQECFDFYKESYDEAFDIGVKRWQETLDKMIWSFQQIVFDDYDDKYHHGDMELDWVKTDEKYFNPITNTNEDLYKMVDKDPDKHWYDQEGHSLHEERIQEGLELFGKYYRSLWD